MFIKLEKRFWAENKIKNKFFEAKKDWDFYLNLFLWKILENTWQNKKIVLK